VKSDLHSVAAEAVSAARSVGPVMVNVTVSGNALSFDFLGVPAGMTGLGLADRAFAAVCTFADRAGVTVVLSADDGFGSDLRRLVRWYSRHGFTITGVGHAVSMRRLPAA
jgi:hypothetical protein